MRRLLVIISLLMVGCGTPVRECVKSHTEYHPHVEYKWGWFTYSDYELTWICDEWKAR